MRLIGSIAAWSARGRKLAILIYHRVLAEVDPLRPDEITARDFRMHADVISRNFNVLPLAEAVQKLEAGRLPSRALAITFDDGYADNESIALPILAEYGLSATFFVATSYLDGGRMWNDSIIEALRLADTGTLDLGEFGLGSYFLSNEASRVSEISEILPTLKYFSPQRRLEAVDNVVAHVGKHLPNDLMMNSDQVRQMVSAGMDIGAHTISHPILRVLSDSEARAEIGGSREALEGIIGRRVTLFAYPNGRPDSDYTERDVALVRKLGFKAAVSTAWGAALPGADLFQLPRFTPWDRTGSRFSLRLIQNYGRTRPALAGQA